MKRFNVGKMLLLSILTLGLSGCFADTEIEYMKNAKIPINEVKYEDGASKYTFQQLSEKLINPKWSKVKGDVADDGSNGLSTTLSGDFKFKEKGKEYSLTLKITATRVILKNGTYFNMDGSTFPIIKYEVKLPEEGSVFFDTSPMHSTCKINGEKTRDKKCRSYLGEIFNLVLSKK